MMRGAVEKRSRCFLQPDLYPFQSRWLQPYCAFQANNKLPALAGKSLSWWILLRINQNLLP